MITTAPEAAATEVVGAAGCSGVVAALTVDVGE